MKTAFKVIGKIVKGYFILNTICLAFIAIGELAEEYNNTPNDSIIDCNGRVFERALQKIKRYYKGGA